MLLWIEFKTRPDIAYAASLVARHMAGTSPLYFCKIYRIGRYLLGTCDKGMILYTDKQDLKLEIYMDSDFFGKCLEHAIDIDINVELACSNTDCFLCFAKEILL